MARISPGWACPVPTRYAIRWVSTRVLPEPAPARIRSGPSPCRTASRWGSLSPSRRVSAAAVAMRSEDRPRLGLLVRLLSHPQQVLLGRDLEELQAVGPRA